MTKIKRIMSYVFLSIFSFVSVFPFAWMVIGATNTSSNVTKGKLTFGDQFFVNFKNLVDLVELPMVLWNSAKIAILTTLLSLLICSLAGYGFEIFRSKVRDRVFAVVLLSMMIPFSALMIPLFRMFSRLGLIDTSIAVIIPSVATAFLIFFFRQNTKSFPQEILQAARVDGLNEVQIFFKIYMPTMQATYAAAAIITFMTNWNNFLWPLIVLQSPDKRTLPIVISSLSSAYQPDFGMIMVAIIIATIPTAVLFFAMQKRFVEGMLGSVK